MHRSARSSLPRLSLAGCVGVAALLVHVAPGGASQLRPRTPRPHPPEHVVAADKAAPPARPGGAGRVDNPRRGVVWADLDQGAADGPCAGLLQARSEGQPICTHGPDPAPAGVEVGTPRSTADLASETAGETAGVPCYGDGTSGKRVQAVYVRAADRPDRYADVVGLIGQWAANVDKTFNDSAAETGGVRHVRWVTGAGCELVVQRAQLSTTGDDSFSATTSELASLGFNSRDRNYLLWTDADVYCGIGGIRGDDRPTADNGNNGGQIYARVDTACWGAANSVEAHELMHNLGGIQHTAPHASGGWHCTDENDRMCYSDGAGVTTSYPCAATHERLFDCNHDDYFSTAPAAGSYLATHWNTASSVFLESVQPAGPTTTTAPPSTTTTTAQPPPVPSRKTLSTSGSLNKRVESRSYALVTGSGTLTATLTYSKSRWLTLQLVASNGALVAASSGGSPVLLSATVPAGSYTLVVLGSSSAAYTLEGSYPAP